MIAAGAYAYAVAKTNPQEEIFFWVVIITVVGIIAHAIYRMMNR